MHGNRRQNVMLNYLVSITKPSSCLILVISFWLWLAARVLIATASSNLKCGRAKDVPVQRSCVYFPIDRVVLCLFDDIDVFLLLISILLLTIEQMFFVLVD